MTKRENALEALHGNKPESVPCYFDAVQIVPCSLAMEAPPLGKGPGYDGFGVHQTPTESAGGMFTPTAGMEILSLDDIDDWEDIIKFPDYDKYSDVDWKEAAAADAAAMGLQPDAYVQDMLSPKGIFERLHLLMGFEDALCAIMMEPETVYDIVGAIADHKIKFIERAAKYYKIDYFTMMDDYSHKDGLFFSVDTFRKIFKPHLKRVVDAVHAHGMIYKQHCCGKMESLLDDFLELGITAFDPVQPLNDIPKMKEKTLGRAGICGGLDVQNVVDCMNMGATEEDIRQEVRRCIDSYAPGGGYMIYGASLNVHRKEARMPGGNLYFVIDECRKYGKDYYR